MFGFGLQTLTLRSHASGFGLGGLALLFSLGKQTLTFSFSLTGCLNLGLMCGQLFARLFVGHQTATASSGSALCDISFAIGNNLVRLHQRQLVSRRDTPCAIAILSALVDARDDIGRLSVEDTKVTGKHVQEVVQGNHRIGLVLGIQYTHGLVMSHRKVNAIGNHECQILGQFLNDFAVRCIGKCRSLDSVDGTCFQINHTGIDIVVAQKQVNVTYHDLRHVQDLSDLDHLLVGILIVLEALLADNLVNLRTFHHSVTLRLKIGRENGSDAIHCLLGNSTIGLEVKYGDALCTHSECQHQQ